MEDVQYTCHFSTSILFLGKVAICTTSFKPKKKKKTERSINFKRQSVSEDLAVFPSNSALCKYQG